MTTWHDTRDVEKESFLLKRKKKKAKNKETTDI